MCSKLGDLLPSPGRTLSPSVCASEHPQPFSYSANGAAVIAPAPSTASVVGPVQQTHSVSTAYSSDVASSLLGHSSSTTETTIQRACHPLFLVLGSRRHTYKKPVPHQQFLSCSFLFLGVVLYDPSALWSSTLPSGRHPAVQCLKRTQSRSAAGVRLARRNTISLYILLLFVCLRSTPSARVCC